MLFLIDENTTSSVGAVFATKGFGVEYVKDIKELRGQPDEVVFEYAVNKQADIVTKDVGFVNLSRFDLAKLPGVVLLRFPNEISVQTLREEIERAIGGMSEADFQKKIIVIEPGNIRSRDLL